MIIIKVNKIRLLGYQRKVFYTGYYIDSFLGFFYEWYIYHKIFTNMELKKLL